VNRASNCNILCTVYSIEMNMRARFIRILWWILALAVVGGVVAYVQSGAKCRACGHDDQIEGLDDGPTPTSALTSSPTSGPTSAATSGPTTDPTAAATSAPTLSAAATSKPTSSSIFQSMMGIQPAAVSPVIATYATPTATATATATPTPSATTASATAYPTASATYTPTPFATATPTPTPTAPAAAIKADVGGYIQAALDAVAAGNLAVVLSSVQSAIKEQTALGNDAVVQLLNVALTDFNQYQAQHVIAQWNQGKIFLQAAQIILSCLTSNASYDYGSNIQSACQALNPPAPQKDTQTAMKYLNNAASVQVANGNLYAAGFLKQAVSFLQLQNQNVNVGSMTPVQAALYEIASALANLNAASASSSTGSSTLNIPNVSIGSSETGTVTEATTGPATATAAASSWWNWSTLKQQYPLHVPQVIQNFLDARAMFNSSEQSITTYLTEKGGYDDLIQQIHQVSNEMNSL